MKKIKHLVKKITIDGETRKVQLKSIRSEIKVADEEKYIIEAYVSRFGNIDSYGDIVVKGAFKEFLKTWFPRYPKGIYAHNWAEPIAKTLECKEDDKGLYVKAELLVDVVPRAKEVWGLIKAGVLTDFSFGFSIDEREYNNEGYRLLKKISIWEWSPVLVGANNQATLLSAKSLNDEGAEVEEEEVEVPDETPDQEDVAPAPEDETTTEETEETPGNDEEGKSRKLSTKDRNVLKTALSEIGFAREDIKEMDSRFLDLEKSIKDALEGEEEEETTDEPETGKSAPKSEPSKKPAIKAYLREARGVAKSSQRLIVRLKQAELEE